MTRTDDFDYELPASRIAQRPVPIRDEARLLVDRGPGSPPDHRLVGDLPDLLGHDDVVVINDTRVRHARLALEKSTGGAVEALLLRPLGDDRWESLIGSNRPVATGTVLTANLDSRVTVEVLDDLGDGRRLVRLAGLGPDPDERLEQIGMLPLPPYVSGPIDDETRYQTVYADRTGSVAAPTAGLHFTAGLLERIRSAGAHVASLQLEVGLATFRPISTERVQDHRMHVEHYRIDPDTWERVAGADRVVAIGTTTVRAIETAAASGRLEGDSSLFVTPGFDWQMVDALMTNFHLPRSSLLVMLEAFMGPRWRDLYSVALAEGYRFLSFGDAMFVERAA